MNPRLACFAFLVGGLLTLTASPAFSLPTTTTTSLTVTGQGSTINFGNEVTLTATVQSDGSPVTPGTVNFCDASATYCTDIHLLGTAQLTSTGTAIYRYVPGPGTHSYKAVFIGTSANAANNYAPSTSPTESVTVYQYYYGQYATATAISASGSVGDYTLTALVGTNGSFLPNGTVSFLDTSNNNGLIDQATLGGNIGLSFLNVSNPATGSYPYSVAEGDFNGDGIEDLAVSGFYGDQITVLLGDGTGKFNPAAQINAPGNFESITVGDFNSDGKLDIAATNESNNTVSVLLGNGNGTFATALSPSTGSSPQSIAVADFNGDGILDLAVANGNDNTVTVLLGNGSGVFPKSATTATSSDPVFVAPGDFNGDGIEDLAVANYASGTISILLGKGDGTFTTAPSLAVGSPRSIAVADFNRDGKPDLAATSYYGDTVTVFLGTGGGNFSTNTTIGTGSQPGAVATGDFNQDGLADLAVANYDSGSVTILLGNGSGSFSAGGSPVAGNSPYALVIGDFNNDGVPDLAVTQGDGNTVATLLTESLTASASINGISLPVATGTHSVEASYPGDTYHYASTSITIPLAAAKGNPVATLSASTTSPSYGSSVTLSVTVTGTGLPPSGTVNFADSGAVLGSATVNGSGVANYTTSSLPQGSNSIQAQYTGDGNYNAAYSNTVTVTVGAAQSQTITFPSIGPQTVGANISLNATASSGLPVSFVSEASSICTVSGSTATMIAAGTCTIQATQPGNSTYSPAPPVSQSFSVSLPVATPPVFSPAGGTYSSAQSVFLSDSSGAPIYYTINGGTPTTSSTPYSGPITVSSSETIRAIAGGSGYANSSVSTASYTINLPGATTTSITTSVNPATLGQTVTFSVTVRPTSGNGIPSGAVTLLIDGVSQGALQLNGAGSVQYSISSLQVGSHTIAASYGGSSSFSTSGGSLTEVVEAFATAPTFSPGSGTYSSVQLVTLADTTSGAVIHYTTDGTTPTASSATYAARPIAVSSSQTIKALAVASGYANSAIAAATYTINLATASTSLTASINPATVGESVTFTARLAYPSGSTTPTGTVTFRIDGGVRAVVTVNGAGQASYSTAALTVGSHSIVATYSGNTIYAPSTGGLTEAIGIVTAAPTFSLASGAYASAQTVTIADATPGAAIYYTLNGTAPSTSSTRYTAAIKVSTSETIQAIAAASGYTNSAVTSASYIIGASTTTTTTLASSRNPTVSGQGVTFTATITGASGTPTGTVNFANAGTVFATAPVIGGVATAVNSSLPLGTNSITATYSGDGSHAASKSAALAQVVQIATTTVLRTSANPSTLNQAVNLTATVTATSGATPTGTVTFYSSATPLATVNLSGGIATTTISTLTAGHHSITAAYSGNSTDAASKSPVLVQTVSP